MKASVYRSAIVHADSPVRRLPFFHFVFAFVGIGNQMTDVGDIDDVPHGVAVQCQHASQHVFEHVGSKVADMRVVVHGRTAAIQPHVVRLNRRESA
jgi:hypothetical protein